MIAWNVVARSNGGMGFDYELSYRTKREALAVAKDILKTEGDKFESIYIVADDGEELQDETYIDLKKGAGT